MTTEAPLKLKCPAPSCRGFVPFPVTLEAIGESTTVFMISVPPLSQLPECEECSRKVSGSVSVRRLYHPAAVAVEVTPSLKVVPSQRVPSLDTAGGNQFEPND